MHRYIREGLLLSLAVFPLITQARAPVEERFSMDDRLTRLENRLDNMQQVDIINQLEAFKNTLQEINGKIEEQQHALSQLTERQRTLYQDLDNRLGKVVHGHRDRSNANEASLNVTPELQSTLQEREFYQKAYKSLRNKKYKAAITQLNAYLEKYPSGLYSPNAYYWLGEVYHLEGKLDEAKKAFKTVVDKYPRHPKAADALLKLGYVYSAIGNKEAAKLALNDVSEKYKGTSLAHLAENRLKRLSQHT